MQTTKCNHLILFPGHKTSFVCLSVYVCLFVCSVVFSGTTILNLQAVNVHQEQEWYTK